MNWATIIGIVILACAGVAWLVFWIRSKRDQ